MKFSTAVGFIVALASSVLASPAPAVTAAPRAPVAGDEGSECSKYDTTTSYHHNFCPMYCVEPDSPECPIVNCLMTVPNCKPDETITHPPLPAPTSVTATVTGKDCTITKEADVGCVLCGCVGCPECAPIKTWAP